MVRLDIGLLGLIDAWGVGSLEAAPYSGAALSPGLEISGSCILKLAGISKSDALVARFL
jgi:hypothetical protein